MTYSCDPVCFTGDGGHPVSPSSVLIPSHTSAVWLQCCSRGHEARVLHRRLSTPGGLPQTKVGKQHCTTHYRTPHSTPHQHTTISTPHTTPQAQHTTPAHLTITPLCPSHHSSTAHYTSTTHHDTSPSHLTFTPLQHSTPHQQTSHSIAGSPASL